MMQGKRDLFGLSVEIKGVAMVIAGLGNQLDNRKNRHIEPRLHERCAL